MLVGVRRVCLSVGSGLLLQAADPGRRGQSVRTCRTGLV